MKKSRFVPVFLSVFNGAKAFWIQKNLELNIRHLQGLALFYQQDQALVLDQILGEYFRGKK